MSNQTPPHFKAARPASNTSNLRTFAAWLLAISAFVVALVGAYLLGASNTSVTEVEILIPTPAPAVVQITGEVSSPGVYELNRNDRVLAAIDAAGGITENADIQHLNLAAIITDGSLIHVPSLPPTPSASVSAERNPLGSVASNIFTEAESSPGNTSTINPATEPINLNSATVEQLKSLPGIGETRANQIIALRTSVGRFSILEQLLDIHGIGEKTLEAIRPMVVVE